MRVLQGLMGLLLLLPLPAQASPSAETTRDAAFKELRNRVQADREFSLILKQVSRQFTRRDVSGDGLDRSDEAYWRRRDEASARANELKKWLLKDLDGDGVVSGEELREHHRADAARPFHHSTGPVAKSPQQIESIMAKLLAKDLAADGNGDGSLSFAELLAAVEKKRAPARTRLGIRTTTYQRFLPFDTDGDGRILAAEIDTVLLALLEEYDRDHNGVFNTAEAAAFKEEADRRQKARNALRGRERTLSRARERCRIEKAPSGARFIELQVGAGAAQATTSVGGYGETTLGDIHIEPGDQPLFLHLRRESYGSAGLLLRFSGSVERVAGLVTPLRNVGVIGLPAEKIKRHSRHGCPPRPNARQGLDSAAIATALFGAAPARHPRRSAAGRSIAAQRPTVEDRRQKRKRRRDAGSERPGRADLEGISAHQAARVGGGRPRPREGPRRRAPKR